MRWCCFRSRGGARFGVWTSGKLGEGGGEVVRCWCGGAEWRRVARGALLRWLRRMLVRRCWGAWRSAGDARRVKGRVRRCWGGGTVVFAAVGCLLLFASGWRSLFGILGISRIHEWELGEHFKVYEPEGNLNRVKPLRPPSYLSSLHSVRRLPGRHMIKKMPIAPMPPTPPKIYKVLPAHFKEAVQMLTAEPGTKTVVPESARDDNDNDNVSEWKEFLGLSSDAQFSDADEFPASAADVFGWLNGPGLGFAPLSPSSLAWWASVLPGGGAPQPPQFEASAVLL
nr:serine/arginine repetitive matrix protein 2-like [Ipomoea batatas]